MPIPNELLRRYRVKAEPASRFAAAYLHMAIASHTPGTADWWGVSMSEPTTIYDITGEPLFYDLPLMLRKQCVGMIRASANRVLGAPVLTAYMGPPPWNLQRAAEQAIRRVQAEKPVRIVRTLFVCYSYPKLGIAVDWRAGRTTERTIFDAGDLSVIPDRLEPGVRGAVAVSHYQTLAEDGVAQAVREFEAFEKGVAEMERLGEFKVKAVHPAQEFSAVQAKVAKMLKASSTCHLALNLRGQETDVWCTVATGQMILEYWGYKYTQTQIANAMSTGSGGTTWAGEEQGLESLTSKNFDAVDDHTPTFAEAKIEIDAGHPFDYSYVHHSMACAGYLQQNWFIFGSAPLTSLELYDPWPPNAGTHRWETWGTKVVDGFMDLRPV